MLRVAAIGYKIVVAQIVVIFLTALFNLAAAQQQQSTFDTVKQRGTLIAGVKTDYPPFGYIDDKGNIAGFDVEIARYIAKKLSVNLELRPVTSANRIPMLQTKTVDLLAATLSITRPRWEVIEFSVPYIWDPVKFLVKKGSGISGFADLADKVVVIAQGSVVVSGLQTEQPRAKLLVLQNSLQAYEALLQGKADAYIGEAAPLLVFAKEHPELEVVGDYAGENPMGIGFLQNDTKWRNAINFALSDMWKDGTYLKVYRDFFGSDPDPAFRIYSWEL